VNIYLDQFNRMYVPSRPTRDFFVLFEYVYTFLKSVYVCIFSNFAVTAIVNFEYVYMYIYIYIYIYEYMYIR